MLRLMRPVPVGFGLGMGSITRRGLGWYENVRKPVGEPPRRVGVAAARADWRRLAFPIAWTALYAAMGYASHLLVRALDRSPSAVRGLGLPAADVTVRSNPRQHRSQALLCSAWAKPGLDVRRPSAASQLTLAARSSSASNGQHWRSWTFLPWSALSAT